jgi:hypothetical protein
VSTAAQLIEMVEANGGRFMIDGDLLGVEPETAILPVLEEVRRSKFEIIKLLQCREEVSEEAALDEQDLCLWLLERCVFHDRWWGGIASLYVDNARWRAGRGHAVLYSRHAFEAALTEQGFNVEYGLVEGLVLKHEEEAFELFREMPLGS